MATRWWRAGASGWRCRWRALGVLSIIGDLFESLLKRRAGRIPALLPGHGGVYDRIDAILPVAPFALILSGVVLTVFQRVVVLGPPARSAHARCDRPPSRTAGGLCAVGVHAHAEAGRAGAGQPREVVVVPDDAARRQFLDAWPAGPARDPGGRPGAGGYGRRRALRRGHGRHRRRGRPAGGAGRPARANACCWPTRKPWWRPVRYSCRPSATAAPKRPSTASTTPFSSACRMATGPGAGRARARRAPAADRFGRSVP